MRLIFASNLAMYQDRLLTEMNANDRLVSYYLLMNEPDSVLEEFVTTGEVKNKILRRKRHKMRQILDLIHRSKELPENED